MISPNAAPAAAHSRMEYPIGFITGQNMLAAMQVIMPGSMMENGPASGAVKLSTTAKTAIPNAIAADMAAGIGQPSGTGHAANAEKRPISPAAR